MVQTNDGNNDKDSNDDDSNDDDNIADDDNTYLVMEAGTNTCVDGYQRLASATKCESYADYRSISYGGPGSFNAYPKGCFLYTDTDNNEIYYNTADGNLGRDTAKPICKPLSSPWSSTPSSKPSISVLPTPSPTSTPSSVFDTYLVMEAGANKCVDWYQRLASATKCKSYADYRDIHYFDTINYNTHPKGCVLDTHYNDIYFNTADGNLGQDTAKPICKPLSSPWSWTPSSKPSISVLTTPPPTFTPSSVFDTYLVMQAGTNKCVDGYQRLASATKCESFADYRSISYG